jgi:hypothetical protein
VHLRRRLRAATALAVVGCAVASGAGAVSQAAAPGTCNAVATAAGAGWLEVQPPFPDEPATVQQVVAPAYLPDRMWATNGVDVMFSRDAGCHWIGVIHPVPGGILGVLPTGVTDLLGTSPSTKVTAIAAPSSTTTTSHVYVGLEDSALLADGVRVGYYDGNRWRYDSTGLPGGGHIAEVAASPTSPTTAYALIDPANALSDGGLYTTRDGGETWEQINPDLRSTDLSDLAVDPGVPNILYGLGEFGVVISQDGGRSFAPGTHQGTDIASYDVAAGGGAVRILQGHTGLKKYDRSDNGGKSWVVVDAPVVAREVAMQPLVDQVAVSDGDRLWVEPDSSVKRAEDVTPVGGAPTQIQVSAPVAGLYTIVGARGAAVLRSVRKADTNVGVVQDPTKPVRLLGANPPKQFPSTLTPNRTELTLPAGGHADVDYDLLLPRTPSPIDVMFLVDTSASMSQTIEGLKRDLGGIINELTVAGLDVQFGIGDFKDYSPLWGYGNGEVSDYPYRLDAPIGPVTPALRAALNALRSRGGGDPPESQLTALYQSTVGSGQHFGRHVLVRKGSAAGYRADSLKLAVLATDERFHHEGYYLTPSWTTTMQTLRANGVHPIGLALQTFNDDRDELTGFHSLKDEQRMASETGSFAPRGGVDCDGDLRPDLAIGEPFVCQVGVTLERRFDLGQRKTIATPLPVHLAPAITTAARSLADFKTVGLSFDSRVRGARVPAGLARVVRPSALPQVNLKTDNELAFTVRYSCPRLKTPRVYAFDVNAGDGSRVLASTRMRVSCAAVPPKSHPSVPPEIVAVAAPPAAAAAPPAPGQPVPNANPNPNPALNANVGFAAQEEEQRQLAFATETGLEDDTTIELAMSRLLIGAGALTFAFGAAYAVRRRTQTSTCQDVMGL